MTDTDTRRKDREWTVRRVEDTTVTFDGAKLAVLMDIRDELKEMRRELNSIKSCVGWSGYSTKELRGLRRDLKAQTAAILKRKRCRRAHAWTKRPR